MKKKRTRSRMISKRAFHVEKMEARDLLTSVFINEFHYDNASTDTGEFVEIAGPAGTDLSGWTLELYNGTSSQRSPYNTVNLSGTLPYQTGGFGFTTINFPTNGIQNGSPDGLSLVDNNGTVVQFLSYEGSFVAQAGAAAGMTSTDIGVSETSSTPAGFSLQLSGTGDELSDFVWAAPLAETPGAVNTGQTFSNIVIPPSNESIFDIQGSGDISPFENAKVTTSGVVVGDFQGSNELSGFFIQDPNGDGDVTTSDGIFVAADTTVLDVLEGDLVEVTGFVSEAGTFTQISTVSSISVLNSGLIINPTQISGPESFDGEFEQYEGMLVEFVDTLTVSQNFFLGRYGQLTLSTPDDNGTPGRLFQPTNIFDAGSQDAIDLAGENSRRLIVLDDGQDVSSSGDNPNPVPYLGPAPPVVLRAGDTVGNLIGVIDFGQINTGSISDYRLQPTVEPTFVEGNSRPATPEEVGGSLKVSAFNVLNYFNGDGLGGGFPTSRGAFDQIELDRQTDKIVPAIIGLDADILGLIEIENDGYGPNSAIAELVAHVNAAITDPNDHYAFVDPGTGTLGSDAIAVGLIYRPARVQLAPGTTVETLNTGEFTQGSDQRHRAPIAATFEDLFTGEQFTVVNNHFKSKGSLTGIPQDNDQGDGQGNNNFSRTNAANELLTWINSDPTGTGGDTDVMVIGDLNAYAQEDPIQAFLNAGYANVVQQFNGSESYSFTFDGQAGSLDHALVSPSLLGNVTGATEWHINTDEPKVIDYEDFFNPPGYYTANQFRASDHDPVLVGLQFDNAPGNFLLELLHVTDQEAGASAVNDVPNLSAVLNALRAEDLGNDGIADNSLTLSSGDAFIPGLFFDASVAAFGSAGIADIQIQNELGFEAIALGNHEFDFGTGTLAGLIDGSAPGTILGSDFTGTNFPYLSSNLDFSTDSNLAPLEVASGQAPQSNSVTSSTIINVNGEKVAVVGATTPTLASISSPGGVGISPSPFDANPTPAQLDALAAEIQSEVDALLNADSSLNKVILLSHMQQINIEFELAERLENVDIIVAGGSNTRLFDDNDIPRPGDSDQGQYPTFITNAGLTETAVVNTDGSYKYVGRLVIEFDASGNIIPGSYDENISGAYRTDDQGVADLNAAGLVDPEIQEIVDAIEAQIIATESNVFGVSEVFLNGNRSGVDTPENTDGVRTQETNLGNLTADANLAEAQKSDSSVVVSLKNGGGIRASIGQTIVLPGGTDSVRLPNEAVIDSQGNIVKPEGGISQNDIQTTLAFNNDLVLLTLTKTELVGLLEHGVSSIPGVSGRFPQISGVKFSYDPDLATGDRIISAGIFDENDNLVSKLVENGEISGNPDDEFRIVTLGFLAAPRFDSNGNYTGGGDGYPFPNLNTDPAEGEVGDPAIIARVNFAALEQEGVQTGSATFADEGTEQDALAEYLAANYLVTPFAEADTGRDSDQRIQNLNNTPDEIFGFTLELLHVTDQEAGASAVIDVPNLSAVLNALRAEDIGNDGVADNTLTLSSGDAIISGLFFDASEAVYGSAGIADIQIQNELGFQAIALGNHEFDFGTATLAGLIDGSAPGSILGEDFAGTDFPYLSANLDFSTDANLAALEVAGGQSPQSNSVASSTIIDVNGEKIAVVGATTPTLGSISSPGGVGIFPSPFDANPTPAQLDALATEIQAEVDAVLSANPSLNKVILLSHMQQINIEFELATRLENVDVIVAGGSNTRLFDDNDVPRPGDSDQGQYPQFFTNAGNTSTAVVNTDGSYKYVGRLVIDFDAAGNIIPSSYDENVSGAYRTDAQGVADLNAAGLVDPEIQQIVDEIGAQIIATEGNVFGVSDVFLNGNRSGLETPEELDGVRTQETNLGNLTADANLAEAQKSDSTVVVSLKNGGGIRANIGQTIVLPGGSDSVRLPNEEVLDAQGNIVKPEGGISQNDIQTTLAFNNDLVLLTLTKTELIGLLEHGVSSIPGVSGRFPQISGVKFSYDPTLAAGDRIISAGIFDDSDNLVAKLVEDGEIAGNPDDEFRIVTLGFLAAPRFDENGIYTGGGDGYPFPNLNTDPTEGEVGDPAVISRVNFAALEQEGVQTGAATFADDGTEQDALAEYLAANYLVTPFGDTDVDRTLDQRIQNLSFRTDEVFPEVPFGITFEDGQLNILGSDDDDTIIVKKKSFFSNDVKVIFETGDTVIKETFSGVNQIIVDGRGGDDHIAVSWFLSIDALLIGGDGNDTIFGGSGRNVIDGGADNDTLIGGFRNDLLIGGTGEDKLIGSFGRDALIGGSVQDDLEVLFAQWSDGTADLETLTVIDDGEIDELRGGFGADTFFEGLDDEIKDYRRWWGDDLI